MALKHHRLCGSAAPHCAINRFQTLNNVYFKPLNFFSPKFAEIIKFGIFPDGQKCKNMFTWCLLTNR